RKDGDIYDDSDVDEEGDYDENRKSNMVEYVEDSFEMFSCN
ncbi:unnamed protein product, partial [Allacma fusca]